MVKNAISPITCSAGTLAVLTIVQPRSSVSAGSCCSTDWSHSRASVETLNHRHLACYDHHRQSSDFIIHNTSTLYERQGGIAMMRLAVGSSFRGQSQVNCRGFRTAGSSESCGTSKHIAGLRSNVDMRDDHTNKCNVSFVCASDRCRYWHQVGTVSGLFVPACDCTLRHHHCQGYNQILSQ